MEGMEVDESWPIEARLAVCSPCDISFSRTPQPLTPIMIISAVRFIWLRGMAIWFMAVHMERVVGDERTHSDHPFNPPCITPNWVVGVIGPYDCDSLNNASLDTRSHLIITNACGLDNDICLLLFYNQPRTLTYDTGGRRDGIHRFIHSRRVLAIKSTPSMAYLALFEAIDAYHGSPNSEVNGLMPSSHLTFHPKVKLFRRKQGATSAEALAHQEVKGRSKPFVVNYESDIAST
eukprot:6210223-Pleurochrysis_carterae.AAC.1